MSLWSWQRNEMVYFKSCLKGIICPLIKKTNKMFNINIKKAYIGPILLVISVLASGELCRDRLSWANDIKIKEPCLLPVHWMQNKRIFTLFVACSFVRSFKIPRCAENFSLYLKEQFHANKSYWHVLKWPLPNKRRMRKKKKRKKKKKKDEHRKKRKKKTSLALLSTVMFQQYSKLI